jgi:putative ABC transport system permease protein
MTPVEWKENLWVALDTLRTHKVRSGLTVLGIVIGVTSVISVAAIIEGLNHMVSERVQSIGSRTFFISRLPAGLRLGQLPQNLRLRRHLTAADAKALRDMAPSISYASPFMTRPTMLGNPREDRPNDIRHGGERVENVFLRGVEPDYGDAIPLFAVAHGRFITSYDVDHTRPVVIIGQAIAEALFPFTDPIGKTVRLNGLPFEVIGVFEKDPGLFGGPGVDQFVCIPFSTFRKEYPEIREMVIAFSVPEDIDVNVAVNEVTEAMRRIRRVPYHGENDFEVLSPDFISNLWSQLTGALFLLTAVISSIGLLVGGIGVMNIMLISVTERTQEIGVRKAIGARRSDIRLQFLMEAVALTVTGGVLGILAGAVIATAVRHLLPSIPASVSPLWVMLGVGMSVSVGVFFGYYPASRAASLDPVVALRYE